MSKGTWSVPILSCRAKENKMLQEKAKPLLAHLEEYVLAFPAMRKAVESLFILFQQEILSVSTWLKNVK